MTDFGHPGEHGRGHRGDARTHEERRIDDVGPWKGTLILRSIELRGAERQRVLEVSASWNGVLPGAPPPSPGVKPGRATDVVVVGTLPEAQAVMRAAGEALRRPEPPDLRHFAQVANRAQ